MRVKITAGEEITGIDERFYKVGDIVEIDERNHIVGDGGFSFSLRKDWFEIIEDTEREELLNKLAEYNYEIEYSDYWIALYKSEIEILSERYVYNNCVFRNLAVEYDYVYKISEVLQRQEELRADLKVLSEEAATAGRKRSTQKESDEASANQAMIDRDGTERREWKDWHKHNTPEKIQDAIEKDCAIAALQNIYLIGSDLE